MMHNVILSFQITWSCKLTWSCCLSCSHLKSWSFSDNLVLPDVFVYDVWSVLHIQANVSNGTSWILSDCLNDGESLNGESLAIVMHK